MMEKMKMHSPNLTQENIARIRELFPGCVTEAQGEDGKLRLAEIVRSNLHVARLVFDPQGVSPRIVTTRVPFKSALGKVVYGNTCTLTPGTVTLMLSEDKLVAHALDAQSAEALSDGKLARKVRWLEGNTEAER